MSSKTLPTSGFGLSWVLPEARDLVTKSLAPSFVFVDYETFINTNVRQRLAKRLIDAYVSIMAPYTLLASIYGWDEAVSVMANAETLPETFSAKKPLERAVEYIETTIQAAADAGADALVICDDLCGSIAPLADPILVIEKFMPLYERFVTDAAVVGLPVIYHSKGDIHEYYTGLAQCGFAGVHVAHPAYEQTASLFQSARDNDLVPLGGLVTTNATDEGIEGLCAFAEQLAHGGPALICDDGAAVTKETFAHIVTALMRVKSACE